MKTWADMCSRAVRALLPVVFSFVLWTLWLALTVLFFSQLYVISAKELSVPRFILRQLESKLEESGLRIAFSRTSFDPAGRVLVENLKLSVPAFAEPIVTARSVYVGINPWLLVVGRIDARDIRLTDVVAFVPAMLSPSGRPEEIIRNLDTVIEPKRRAVTIHHLSAIVTGIPVSAQGTLVFAPAAEEKTMRERISEFIAGQFPVVCRQALALAEQVRRFDEPTLRL